MNPPCVHKSSSRAQKQQLLNTTTHFTRGRRCHATKTCESRRCFFVAGLVGCVVWTGKTVSSVKTTTAESQKNCWQQRGYLLSYAESRTTLTKYGLCFPKVLLLVFNKHWLFVHFLKLLHSPVCHDCCRIISGPYDDVSTHVSALHYPPVSEWTATGKNTQ